MTRPASPRITPDSVRKEALEKKRAIDAELVAMRARLGISASDAEILPLDENGEPNLAALYERMAQVSAEIKNLGSSNASPTQIKTTLDNFIREQDRFMVAMKVAQGVYFSNVVADCDSVERAIQIGNAEETHRLAEKMRGDIVRINELPSLADFETRSDELARLASLQSVAIRMVDNIDSAETPLASNEATSAMSRAAASQMAGSLSEALEANIRPFAVFISNQTAQKKQPIPQATSFANVRDQIVGNSIEFSQNQAKRYQELSNTQNKELLAQKAKLEEELKQAKAKLAEEEKPKSAFARFLTAITFRAYKGGLPTDTTATRAKIAELQGNLQGVEQKIANNEAQAREALGMAQDLMHYRDSVIAAHQETQTAAFARGTKLFIDELDARKEVRTQLVVREQKSEAKQSKQELLENALRREINQALAIARAIRDGKVTMNGDTTESVLGGVELASTQIPVVGQAIGVVAKIAAIAHRTRRTKENTDVANFGRRTDGQIDNNDIEDSRLRDAIMMEFATQIAKIYGHQTNGASPLDPLTRTGIGKFADFIVLTAISQIADFKLPEDAKIPELDAVRFASNKEYRDAIAKEYDIKIDDSRIALPSYHEEIDRMMCAKFVAGELVSATLAPNTGKLGKLGEIASKVRFKEGDVEEKHKDEKRTAQGMLYRAGIDNGTEQFTSTQRTEGVEGTGSKYGLRQPTQREQRNIAAGRVINGYQKFTPARQIFDDALDKFIDGLKFEDFKRPEIGFMDRQEVVRDFVAKCCEGRQQDEKFDVNEYAKQNPLFKIGKSLGALGNADRRRFREIVSQLKTLVDLDDKARKFERTQSAPSQAAIVDHQDVVLDFAQEGVSPSQIGEQHREEDHIFANADSMYSEKKRGRLQPHLQDETSHRSAASQHQLEGEKGAEAWLTALIKSTTGIDPHVLPGALQQVFRSVVTGLGQRAPTETVSAEEKRAQFASYAAGLAEHFKTESDRAHPDSEEAINNLQHHLNISGALQTSKETRENYEQKRDGIKILASDLVDAKQFVSIDKTLLRFAESYHAKMVGGANKDEIREFCTSQIATFLRTDNSELVKQVVDSAAAYSNARFAEAQLRSSVTSAMEYAASATQTQTQTQAQTPTQSQTTSNQNSPQNHVIESEEVMRSVREVVDQLRKSGALQQEGNHITLQGKSGTHLVVETDEHGEVRSAHTHAEQVGHHHTETTHIDHHNIAREIIEEHQKQIQEYQGQGHRGGGIGAR